MAACRAAGIMQQGRAKLLFRFHFLKVKAQQELRTPNATARWGIFRARRKWPDCENGLKRFYQVSGAVYRKVAVCRQPVKKNLLKRIRRFYCRR